MSIIKFAMICDQCGKRSREYGYWYSCETCMDDVCDDCTIEETRDDETGKAWCKKCNDESIRPHVDPVAEQLRVERLTD